jgi:outer membrane protein insertion porin family
VVTDAIKKDAVVRIQKYYSEKGYGLVDVEVKERADTLNVNSVILTFDIAKGTKTHINQVNIAGNTVASDLRLKRTLKSTKEMTRISLHPADKISIYEPNTHSFNRYVNKGGFLSLSKTQEALDPYFRFKLFSSSKFNPKKYEDDKISLVGHYNSLGYRDAAVDDDTIYKIPDGNLNVDIKIKEGHRYYFGNMEWKGNTKYSNEHLSKILGIKKGDIYNQELLDKKSGKQLSPEGGEDISSLYMDDGYLFFNIDAVETSIVGDTINYEMRITEGPQATIRNVTIVGNDRTNEHVIRRELFTWPGNKFSRADLIRSNRQIANLGFFDQEHIGIQPKPNAEDGTVDIAYTVVEKSSDQLQLSAGFGGGVRFYGNVGVTFTNFSIRNIFKPKFWDPLPVGDGQKFSINYQSNGRSFNSLNFGFTEPWLGGKKPNALTTNLLYSRYASDLDNKVDTFFRAFGGGVSLSKRLKWPDDNFVFTYGINYYNYLLSDYAFITDNAGNAFKNGTSNNLHAKLVLARYSVDQPLYPRSGSNISFTFQFTPPYSQLFDANTDYSKESVSKRYKWIEYHKYRFTADWYHKVTGGKNPLVLKLSTKYGFIGFYNPDIGYSPFERFQVGGDGLGGYNFFLGKDILAHRGYKTPYATNATLFNKYTAELRFPFSLNPTATIYGLGFVEAANAWNSFAEYNPFKLNRSAGVGIRVFLPMFGLLGLDYGIGFDRYYPGAQFKDIAAFTFMLGFEPD